MGLQTHAKPAGSLFLYNKALLEDSHAHPFMYCLTAFRLQMSSNCKDHL